MTYLHTYLTDSSTTTPPWMQVVAEANRQRPNTFSTPWRVGETVDGGRFEEYPAHWLVFQGRGVWIVAKNDDGARILRYAAFELGLFCEEEGSPPVDFTPAVSVTV